MVNKVTYKLGQFLAHACLVMMVIFSMMCFLILLNMNDKLSQGPAEARELVNEAQSAVRSEISEMQKSHKRLTEKLEILTREHDHHHDDWPPKDPD